MRHHLPSERLTLFNERGRETLTAAELAAAPCRVFIKFVTDSVPLNPIAPSPTTSAGEYAPMLMFKGAAMTVVAATRARRVKLYCMLGEYFSNRSK